jgi:2-polyprenyl-6-methoxyphenol hydroxylase-like FAD-dependent oxidoreductase
MRLMMKRKRKGKQKQKQKQQMEMMTPATIRDKPRSLLAITRLRVHPLRALSKSSPAPHLLLRRDCNPSGTQRFPDGRPWTFLRTTRITAITTPGEQAEEEEEEEDEAKTKALQRQIEERARQLGEVRKVSIGPLLPTPSRGSRSRSDLQPFLPTSLSPRGDGLRDGCGRRKTRCSKNR